MGTSSKATGTWSGSLKQGKGTMKPDHAPAAQFGVGTRFEGAEGSNPEEFIGAALAGCFSMALSAELGKADKEPKTIETKADVTLVKNADGFAIESVALTSVADIPGIDNEQFQRIAQTTKENCPVSKALAAIKITLSAKLA